MSVITSCSSEEYVSRPSQEQSNNLQCERISAQEAAERAAYIVAELRGTRGVPAVRSVEALGNTLTRSDSGIGDDTLVYLVNFENEEGFAIMGARRGALPMYAVSDEGNLSVADTQREGLNVVMAGIMADAALRPIIPLDSIKWVGPTPDPWVVSQYRKSTPLLSYMQRMLGYTEPFNKYCKTSDGQPAQSGCTAGAIEQIMSFHKWPQSYGGYRFDWEKMQIDDYDGVARLLYLLGLPGNLDYDYDINGMRFPASADPFKIIPVLRTFGYDTPNSFLDFFRNEDIAREALKNEPLLMKAYSTVNTDSGHCWVIDGYMTHISYGLVGTDEKYNKFYYHCSWGWGGDCNGYYYVTDAKAFIGVPDAFHPEDNGKTGCYDCVYQDLYVQFLYNIKPAK